jgi:hypothetical protein
LATEVVADRLNSIQRLHGRGAWLTGLGPVGDLPGPQWRAPRRVIDRLLAVLRPLSARELLEISRRRDGEPFEGYWALADRLRGWAMVSPSGCPWSVLDDLPGVLELKRSIERKMKLIAPLQFANMPAPRAVDLQEWATVMTSAACHRNRLAPSDVAALTAPFLDLLPELPAVIKG